MYSVMPVHVFHVIIQPWFALLSDFTARGVKVFIIWGDFTYQITTQNAASPNNHRTFVVARK
jgi:hypothetical protein